MHKLVLNQVPNLKESFVDRITEAEDAESAAASTQDAVKDNRAIKSLLAEIFNQVKADFNEIRALESKVNDYQRSAMSALRIDSAIDQKHGYLDGIGLGFVQGMR